MSGTFSHGYALLIGVGESAYPKWSLAVTVKDMQALRTVLIDPIMCGYPNDSAHIRLLHDTGATKQAILDGLNWLAEQSSADEEATCVVFYSGHGAVDKNTGEYYLLPHDVNPSELTSSALSAETFTKALRSIKARRLLVFMDCCHAAGMVTAKDAPALKLPPNYSQEAMPMDLAEELKQGKGRAVFSSSTSSQLSWIRPDGKLSIYTYHLIEALYGAGNRPGETLVRLSNLMNHLGESVKESVRIAWGTEQTPFFYTATENFPIALLCGGKGLSSAGSETAQVDVARKIESLLPGISTDEQAHPAGIHQAPSKSFENPFQPLNGRIADPSKVFDRDREVQKALDFLRAGSSVVFLGDHGAGKSSLLTLLQDRVSEKLGWEACYIDLQMVGDDKSFYEAICEELGVPTARGYRLSRTLNGRRILLVLDEVEKIAWECFTRNLRAELRGLAEGHNAPLKLALATSTPLDRLFPDSEGNTSPLAGICVQIDVHPWELATARNFMLERLKPTQATFSEEEIQQLFQASSGIPQRLMCKAFSLYSKKQEQAR